MGELLTRMFFGGFVRMHILYHAVKEPIYGTEMIEELRRHGYEIGPGTLYPILHQLHEAGLLVGSEEVVGGLGASTLATLLVLPSVFAVVMGGVDRRSASIHPFDPESSRFVGEHRAAVLAGEAGHEFGPRMADEMIGGAGLPDDPLEG